jgi:hypothetical protein
MEAMQADGLLDGLFNKSTGMVNPDGKTGGRLGDKLRKQREERLVDGKVSQDARLYLVLSS